ncbi:MAG: hypothetical protein QF893_21910, partial [Alphaproteobacteria bacterium]|nr:hypothetical protein [Alphaproteobacteria bacterium]
MRVSRLAELATAGVGGCAATVAAGVVVWGVALVSTGCRLLPSLSARMICWPRARASGAGSQR